MIHTKNPMQEKLRLGICELLRPTLANAIDLTSQAKQAHWNVKGPNFMALHELFDQLYVSFGEYSDLLAERIVQLGGIAEGTIRMASAQTSLPEYPKDLCHEREHVAMLSHAIACFCENISGTIKSISETEDVNTIDMLTEIFRGSDKYLWFVESHNQELKETMEASKVSPQAH